METLHIKLDIDESINSKRKLLSAQINLLDLIKRVQNYRNLRSLELKRKTVLRTKLGKLISEMRAFQRRVPKTKQIKRKEAGTERIGKATGSKLEKELQKIKDELEKLA